MASKPSSVLVQLIALRHHQRRGTPRELISYFQFR